MSAHTAQYPGGCVLTRRSLCVVRRRDSNKSADKAMTHPKRSGEVSARAPTVSSRAVHALCAALSPGVVCCCFPLPLFAAGGLHWRMRPLRGQATLQMQQMPSQRNAEARRTHAATGAARRKRKGTDEHASDALPPSCSPSHHSQQQHSVDQSGTSPPRFRILHTRK